MKRPNVLILFSDQQRFDTVNAAGFHHMLTPNLDRLANAGCIYMNAHSSNPVCMPARHDMLTGLTARAHGYYGNNHKNPIKDYGIPTLPRIFSENGYRTVAVGKMHFSPPRMHHGFSEMFLMEEILAVRQDDQYACYLEQEGLGHIQNLHGVRPHIYHIPQNAQTDEKHHGTTWVADKAIDWLKTNNGHPFFMMCGWIQPHPPWNIPTEFDGIYSGKDIPEPIPMSRDYPDTKEGSVWHGDHDSQIHKRKIRESYYTAVTMVDKHVGRILDYLEESNQLDNTLIIFTSDHGEMLQDKGYYSKELPYEGAVRIPFIVRYPEKFGSGKICNTFVDLLDVMPTCLDVCGLKYKDTKYELPGESLCTVASCKDRRCQVSSTGFLGERRWVMSRNDRYKYVYYYNQGTEEFYDMKKDPGEIVNLLKTGEYPYEVYKELQTRAIEYEKEWGPEGAVQNDEFIKIDGKQFHGSVCGKFHYWSNSQMQYYDERTEEERGHRLIEEMEYALSNFEKSKVSLNEVFNDETWKKDFINKFHEFGVCEGFEKKIFK